MSDNPIPQRPTPDDGAARRRKIMHLSGPASIANATAISGLENDWIRIDFVEQIDDVTGFHRASIAIGPTAALNLLGMLRQYEEALNNDKNQIEEAQIIEDTKRKK